MSKSNAFGAPFFLSAKQILQQLKRDLIGKDSHRGITLTYAWLANQMGHFALGAIPTIIVFKIATIAFKTPVTKTSIYSAIGVTIFWLLFETYNLLVPILLPKKNIPAVGVKIIDIKKSFNPPWKNLIFDTVTDILFFAFGATFGGWLVYCNTYWHIGLWWIPMALLLVTLSIIGKWWYINKLVLQQARYPFQFRLGQWNFNNLKPTDIALINSFINNNDVANLLIVGALNTGKTSLAVGIATEVSINMHTCYYTTLIKLLSRLNYTANAFPHEADSLWNWKDCQLLVIDDINPEDPFGTIFTGVSIANAVNKSQTNNYFTNRKIIWVLGENAQNKLTDYIASNPIILSNILNVFYTVHNKLTTFTWIDYIHMITKTPKDKIAVIDLNP